MVKRGEEMRREVKREAKRQMWGKRRQSERGRERCVRKKRDRG